MEIFGKVTHIFKNREGESSMGNHYEIQSVVLEGNESVVVEVFGTLEHLKKYGVKEGAKGEFKVKTEVRESKDGGRWFTSLSMDVRNDVEIFGFEPVKGAKEEPNEEEKKIMELLDLDLQGARDVIAKKAKKQEEKAATQKPQEGDTLPF